jgi:hypothetical protein
MLKRILCLLTIVLFVSTYAFSQVTTSSITGSVKDANGQPLVGATVTAIHTPSGSTYSTIAGKDGVFTLPNLRIGGPYSVKITFSGEQPFNLEGFNLELGQPYNINAVLSQNVQALETVIIAGRSRRSAPDKTGASTNINTRQLNTLPTITRSLTDFTRLTPQANGNSFAGRDGRYNNVQVDGANLNNNFGLSTDPLPGGGNTPISLDAIDEINVNISPVDVRQANFTGAGISAVTRSGDNSFKGSVYGYYRDQSYNGTEVAGSKLPPLVKTSNKIYGARIGGPIIKNKLFFFINAEMEKKDFPSTSLRPAQPGVSGSNASATPIDSLAKLSQFLKAQYGYETGAYDNIPTFNSDIHRIIGRIDWNLSEKHRVTLKYLDYVSTTPNNSVVINGTSIPGGGGSILSSGTTTVSITRLGNNRFSQNSYGFENSNYGFRDVVRSGTFELNSRFNTRISNQLLATITKVRDTRTYKGGTFPTLDFLNVPAGNALNNSNYMTAGMDPFTYNNDVINDIYTVTDNLSYYFGKHTITGGASYEYQRVGNQFMPGSNSYYLYRNLNDFITNQAPIYFALTYSLTKGTQAPYAADMKLGQFGIYAQDEFQVNSNFKLTYGLRVDRPVYIKQPGNNAAFSALTFQDKHGAPARYNTQFPKESWYWSPRVGFRWDAQGDKKLIVRGSTGLYTGRIPFVYLTNIPSNSGIIQNTAAVFNTVANPTATSGYLFNKDPSAYASTFPQTAGTSILPNSTFASANPNFKFPQVWRSDLAFDRNLGNGFLTTVEAIYTKDINAVYIRNANLPAPNSAYTGSPDTRPRYTGTNANRINSTISGNYVLENTSKGGAFIFTAQLSKAFTKGLYGSLAYTYTFATDVTANPGSQASSVWNSNPQSVTGNTLELAYSNFAVPHRVVGSVSYRIEYLKKLASTISLYYEGATDGLISYTYSADINGDGNGFDLVYIPRDASEINFANATINGVTYNAAQQWEILNQFIENDPYLRKHRGQYAERNGGRLPWYNRLDAKFLQDIFTNIGSRRHTLQFSIDILNLPNLINHDWGAHRAAVLRNLLVPNNTTTTSGAPQFKINSANNQPVLKPYQDVISTTGTYGFQLGLRYIF